MANSQHQSADLISWREQSAKSKYGPKTMPTSLTTYQPHCDSSALSSTFSVPAGLLNKYQIYTKGHFHRFPHKHHLIPPSSILGKLTRAPEWTRDPAITPLWVLAATQEPHSAKNGWKYSYKFK